VLAKLMSLSAKVTGALSYFGVGVAENAGSFRADWIIEIIGLALGAEGAGAGAGGTDVGVVGTGGTED
jgi:hypothetical protein